MLDSVAQLPPHAIETEQALLGAVLLDNEVIDRVAGIVQPADFFDAVHAQIFSTALAMRADGRKVTPLTLKPTVVDWPAIDDLPVWQYLGRLVAHAASVINAVDYAETVREFSARRKMFALAEDLMRQCSRPDVRVNDAASEAVTALDDVLAIARSTSRVSCPIGDAMRDALDAAINDDGANRMTTGLGSLDATLAGGWRRKQYIIVAGRPSMGKTAIVTSGMLRTAKAGHGVLMLSLEMPTEQIAARALTDLSYTTDRKITYSSLAAGNLNDGELTALAKSAQAFRDLPIVIEDQRGLTVAEIGARVRAHAQKFEKAGKRLGLVIIDHLGFIRASDRYRGNRVHEVTEISAGLGQIAKDNDIALVVLSQLNRGTEGRENKRPTMADLRDSGSLEQDADVIIFAYRPSYYLERTKYDAGSMEEEKRVTELEATRNTLELIVSKVRQGTPNAITLFCDIGSNVIRDLAS